MWILLCIEGYLFMGGLTIGLLIVTHRRILNKNYGWSFEKDELCMSRAMIFGLFWWISIMIPIGILIAKSFEARAKHRQELQEEEQEILRGNGKAK